MKNGTLYRIISYSGAAWNQLLYLRWWRSPLLESQALSCRSLIWRLPAFCQSRAWQPRGRSAADWAPDGTVSVAQSFNLNGYKSKRFDMSKLSWLHVFSYLMFCEVSFNQRAHHLLWGASGADVRKDEFPMGLLCITNPAWIKKEIANHWFIIIINLKLIHI